MKARRQQELTIWVASPLADPEKAACPILTIANAVEPVQVRIHIEKINGPLPYRRPRPNTSIKLTIERVGPDVRHLYASCRRAFRVTG